LVRGRVALAAHPARAPDRGGHREELDRDVDHAKQERLPALEARAMDEHPVENRAREPPARPVDEAHVTREPPEPGEARPAAPADPARRIPNRVERDGAQRGADLRPEARLRIDQGAGDLKVPIDRLARHEKMHDLARALEDAIYARVAHHPL